MSLAMLVIAAGMLMPDVARQQTPQEWRLQPVVAIGGAAVEDDRYTFDLVTTDGVAGRANGNLLVLDVRGRRVLEYDGAGRHVQTLGRQGDGPGEFRFPTALALGAADSVWVFDVARVTIFGGSRAPRTVRTDTRTFGLARVHGDGYARALSAAPARAGVGGLAPDRTHLARFTAAGVLRDTLLTGPYPRRVPVTISSGNSTQMTHAVEQFGVATHWDQLRDGSVVVSDTSAYRLRIVGRDGRVLRTLGSGTPARAVTDADRERARARIREARSRRTSLGSGSDALFRKQLEETPFAAVVPRVTGVRVDPRNRIWVGVSGRTDELERIDVYDATGRLVARVVEPPGMPAALYADRAVFLERDEFDAQRLLVFRVIESGRP